MSHNSLSALPEGVFDNLSNLEWLSLEANDLSALSDGVFDNTSNLEWLNLNENDLSALPEGVFDNLSNLKWLSLDANDLSALPEGVFDNTSNLNDLFLSHNSLSALPDGVFDDTSNLNWLSLEANDLGALPEGIFDNTSNLEWLNLNENDLSALPEGIFDNLSNLEWLNLYENDLSELPDDLVEGLSNLYWVQFSLNPGAPFTFTAELAQDGKDAVAVGVDQAVPFDMALTLSAQGGTLSPDTVTVHAGTYRSERILVTPDADGPVTVEVVLAVFKGRPGFHFYGIQTAIGQPLTLKDGIANNAAAGLPIISGTAQVGETLTVDTTAISDADGLGNAVFEYQWLADDTEVAGETSSTYIPVDADVGKGIKVQVTFTDDRDFEESLASEATEAVAAAATSADDGAIWSATMTVGIANGNSGFSTYTDLGELTPTGFTLDGAEYFVKILGESDGQFYFALNPGVQNGFRLHVGEAQFASEDASIRTKVVRGTVVAYIYQWDPGR